jgi:hypothetical protein
MDNSEYSIHYIFFFLRSYVYDRQLKNKVDYLRVKTKADVDTYLV